MLVLRGTVGCGDEAELRPAFSRVLTADTRVLTADRLPLIVDLGALLY